MTKVLLLVAALFALAIPAVVTATKPPDHKITICHARPADTAMNGWIEITVDVASVGYQHSGHEDRHDADIIPPYTYGDFTYPGKGDQAILANGCVLPTVTPTPVITPCPDCAPATQMPSLPPEPTPRPTPTTGTPTPTPEPTPEPTPAPTIPGTDTE